VEDDMAQYLVLIYGDEKAHAAGGQPLWDELMNGHMAFGTKHEKALAGGQALQDTSTATSIRGDGKGSFTVTDGPFAETKEALGGFYQIECQNLDQAIDAASRIPSVGTGSIEVRPIMEFDTP
jgi:hypothetical protein